jgi:hypothetical protein
VVAADAGDAGRLIGTALGVFVASAVATEELLRSGSRWRHYRSIVEVLKAEGWVYIARAGEYSSYADHRDAFQDFADRVGTALQRETEDYIGRIVADRTTSGTGTPGEPSPSTTTQRSADL